MIFLCNVISTLPEMRTKSLSSPTPPMQSGKSSPCPNYSGKSSPCPTIEECEPQNQNNSKLLNLIQSLSPEAHLGAKSPLLFRPLTTVDGHLAPPLTTQITPATLYPEHNGPTEDYSDANVIYVEVEKLDQFCQTDLDDENLTLVQWRLKYEGPFPEDPISPIETPPVEPPISDPPVSTVEPEPTKCVSPKHDDKPIQLNPTTASLNQMETQFLAAELADKTARSPDRVPVVPRPHIETTVKKAVPKYSSVLNRSVSAATSSTSIHPPRIGSRPATSASGVRTTTPAIGIRQTTASSKAMTTGPAAAPSVGPRRIDMPKGVYPRVNTGRASMVMAANTSNQVRNNAKNCLIHYTIKPLVIPLLKLFLNFQMILT